ncbi:hypothetical protein DFA_10244 [Cavenderia fasciculata]|uniref:Leucine-rich repeat-containing protein n=1 Tax=Cavenderia fasciculata TaxID=261658 RepID=F4Q9P0_CACFS|nr:uncharacterized protein DFA_10244 [Cavenderia fasciculata]EGG15409.1 hypothetical protein DFA_10244 [Cavenderia fasciculata]|eukprot:XP_004354151.1 hypothetical protein DFA_10244 [Cavenderia fasciculata]
MDPNGGGGDGVVVLPPPSSVSSATSLSSSVTSPQLVGSKSHVKELKRLFESKKVVVLDKLSSLKHNNKFNSSSSSSSSHSNSNSNNNNVKKQQSSAATPTTIPITTASLHPPHPPLSSKSIDVSSKETSKTITPTTTTSKLIQNVVVVQPQQPTTTVKESADQQKSVIILDKEYKDDDFELSASDRKYYFYVNEAIRSMLEDNENQPIIPSLAIRRKSLDLTNSPIKGSLYASKYQHTYSPTTRTLQLSRTPTSSLKSNSTTPTKPSSLGNHHPSSPYTGDNNLSLQLHKYQPDTSWIKSKEEPTLKTSMSTLTSAMTDDHMSQPKSKTGYGTIGHHGKKTSTSFLNIGQTREIVFNPLNNNNNNSTTISYGESPTKPSLDDIQFRKLSITKSSFELNNNNNNYDFKSVSSPSSPTNSFLLKSKEEPTPKKSSHFSKKEEKKEKEKEREKEKAKQKSFLSVSPTLSSTSSSSLEKTIAEKEEKGSSSKLFSWVSLRRIKRSNTTEIQPNLALLSKSTGGTKKELGKVSISSPLTVSSRLSPRDHHNDDNDNDDDANDHEVDLINHPPHILINDNATRLSPIINSPSSPNTTTTSTTNTTTNTTPPPTHHHDDNDRSSSSSKKKSFISHSIMIFKKDMSDGKSSYSQPSSPTGSAPTLEDGSPKRFMSIASTMQKGKSNQPLSSSPNSNNNNSYSTLSAPASPSHSSKNQQHPISSSSNITISTTTARQISLSEDTIMTGQDNHHNNQLDKDSTNDDNISSSLPHSTSSLLKPTNLRVEQLVANTRVGRSSSVGSLVETPRFDVADIPPLKVHVASLEECLEQFQKPWHPIHGGGGGRCFILDLANCSLGNEGLEQINQECPGGLEVADLSWNDISDQAFEEFGEMLRRTQSLITSLSMQGNQISPTSVQNFLDSVGQIDKEKKGYYGFGFNLKETGIENEGAEYLANYIGANRTPAIVGLNLTCASVTDVGMTHFSGALVRNSHLTTLILDENYLGDDGAVLLAEGLKFNKTLTHLQMRNTDIGENGSIELSNACKFNTTISHIDLSLNPWGLGGEIALQSLLVTKQMLARTRGVNVPKVVWKDEGMDFWDEDETKSIISHFGKEKIIDYLVNGLTLSPLISQEKIFEHFNIETTHLSIIFKQIVNVDNHINDNHLNALKLLIQLLPTHLDNHIFLNTFLNNLQPLIALINRTNKRVDYLLLNLLEFFTLLTQSNDITCFDKFNEFSLYSKCLELFFEFPCNNILHQNILNLVIASTKHSNFNRFEQSIYRIDWSSKLVAFLTLESQNEPGCRTPNYGHLLEISKLLKNISTSHPYLATKEWKQFQSTILEKESQLQEEYLCGFVPNRNQKIDTALLDKFEKEFKRKIVFMMENIEIELLM